MHIFSYFQIFKYDSKMLNFNFCMKKFILFTPTQFANLFKLSNHVTLLSNTNKYIFVYVKFASVVKVTNILLFVSICNLYKNLNYLCNFNSWCEEIHLEIQYFGQNEIRYLSMLELCSKP